jgi:hypothetical protein
MGVAVPPLPQYAFIAWCSVRGEHRDNFNKIPNNNQNNETNGGNRARQLQDLFFQSYHHFGQWHNEAGSVVRFWISVEGATIRYQRRNEDIREE